MELRHCRYFVAVAEELHFGRAARRLSISQPPLSQQIRDLERDLGVELFKRTRRSVRLTSAGEVFLQAARKLLRSVEDSMDVTRRAARGEVGTIRVGYAPGVEIEILPRVLQAFTQEFPEVDVKLVALHSRDQIDALRQGRLDVALVLLPGSSEGLIVKLLRKESLILVTPVGHPLCRKRTVSFRDLESVPYVHLTRSYEPAYHDHILGLSRGARVTLRVVAESGHLYDNLSLIAAGVGVSLLPNTVRRVRRAGLAYRTLRNPQHTIGIGLAHRPNEFAPPTLAFIQILRRTCAGTR